MLVLLIEDNRQLASNIIEYLAFDDIECDYAERGDQGLALAQETPFDIILLDLNLPRLNGLTIAKTLRDEGNNTPILMLTARDSLDNKLEGFAQGADDYLVKPFALPELVARIKALVNRSLPQHNTLKIDDLVLNLHTREATRQNKTLNLNPVAWELLVALAKASPAPLSRETLEEVVWQGKPPNSDALKSHLYQLRKLVNKPFSQPILHTLRGVGVALRHQAGEE
ncbi:response regulator transcription factor [Marinomonas sp. PE14-40]|uniref:response regulator transcription factor n=1 Tax=Marinomonas sp. PE14-40 TaxID=3060621 RepID=UPI003F66A430